MSYRSRAAFKLIQLNRKYEFLQRSNVIIDLCAAPGGWLQVAAENAPMSNHIIGIDLVTIPPVRNVKTLQEDITTEKCRQALKKELHTAKADCVLNDGAPNVGKNWVHDAFQQAELTLHAMKLATEFLRKGGWFVTKVFRSKDYDALMWVFQQLFKEVHATKPQASRNESAEIFVVCKGYLSPDKIDPKFMDPKHVFKEVDTTQRAAIDLIHPEKKRRQREGYPEGDYTLFHSLPVTEFFVSEDFMDLLAQSSEIAFDSEEIKNHPLTTAEIKECLKDIKLLGKKDIKSIFLWRKKLKKELEKSGSLPTQPEEQTADDEKGEEDVGEKIGEDEAEMEELENLLEAKNKEELQVMKKAKKKVRKAQMKQKARIDLKMTIPGDMPDIQDDENIFDIKKIRSKTELAEVEKGDLSHMDGTDIFEDSDDERPKKRKREYFDRDEKRYAGVEGGGDSDDDEEEEMEEEPMFDDDDDDESEGEEKDSNEREEDAKENANPLIIDMNETSRIKKDKQSAWFKKAAFAGLEDDFGEDLDLDNLGSTSSSKQSGKESTEQKKSAKERKNSEKGKKSNGTDSGFDDENDEMEFESDDDNDDEESDDDGDSDSDYDFNGLQKAESKKKNKKQGKTKIVNGVEIVPKGGNSESLDASLHLDEEGLAIGAAMVQSRKRRRDIVDAAYHRFMFDDDNLPGWFVSDEKRHLKRQTPVSKEEMEEYKLKMKAVDAQPIKKIAEAKARKKRKMLKKQEKARKKANVVTEGIDVSEKEKWQQIKQIYKKAGLLKKSKPSVTYVVAKKGAGKKVRRPAGVKGQFKVVDNRMKKDVRAQMKVEARSKGKMKTGKKSRGRTRR